MPGFRFWKSSQSPRTLETGTSYTAKGAITPQGVGLEQGSSRGGLFRDVIPQLGTRSQSFKVYEEMTNSDSAVDISLRAAKMPVMGADYFVEPFSDNPIDLDIAEFVGFNLLEGQSAPFLSVLSDIMTFYEFGFSVLEQVYELREWAPKRTMANRRKYTMLKKLAPRPTPTILQINYDDNGGPVSIDQNAVDAENKTKKVTIPIEKAIVFSNNKRGGNLEGKSLLRSAYKSWYFKSNLYNIDGIQKERHGMGFPIVDLPVGAGKEEIDAAKELVRNVRTNEHGGAVLKPGWNLRFAELPGNPVDVMASIQHHNGMILLNTMTQFLVMGLDSSGGSRATSGSSQDMFNKSLRYVANLICDMMNLYCIPLLVSYNFQTDHFPRIQVKNVGETKDLQQWAAAVANLLAQNAITPDYETEQWVRSILDAPSKRGGVQTPIQQQQAPQTGNVTSQNGGTQSLPTDQAQPTG